MSGFVKVTGSDILDALTIKINYVINAKLMLCSSGTVLYINNTFHPALRNMSAWLQGRSGLVMTRPGPIMLKELSTWMGLGSRNETMCTLYLSPR